MVPAVGGSVRQGYRGSSQARAMTCQQRPRGLTARTVNWRSASSAAIAGGRPSAVRSSVTSSVHSSTGPVSGSRTSTPRTRASVSSWRAAERTASRSSARQRILFVPLRARAFVEESVRVGRDTLAATAITADISLAALGGRFDVVAERFDRFLLRAGVFRHGSRRNHGRPRHSAGPDSPLLWTTGQKPVCSYQIVWSPRPISSLGRAKVSPQYGHRQPLRGG
jgi:hypothetical protein